MSLSRLGRSGFTVLTGGASRGGKCIMRSPGDRKLGFPSQPALNGMNLKCPITPLSLGVFICEMGGDPHENTNLFLFCLTTGIDQASEGTWQTRKKCQVILFSLSGVYV